MKLLGSVLVLSCHIFLAKALLDCPLQAYESACTIDNIDMVTFGTAVACEAVVTRGRVANPPTVITANMPSVFLANAQYTIVMVDPDYLSPPVFGKPNLLWIKSNVPVANGAPDLTMGTELARYIPPSFVYNGNTHRVVLLAFKHLATTGTPVAPLAGAPRSFFKLASWLYKNRNAIECRPIAGFQVRVN